MDLILWCDRQPPPLCLHIHLISHAGAGSCHVDDVLMKMLVHGIAIAFFHWVPRDVGLKFRTQIWDHLGQLRLEFFSIYSWEKRLIDSPYQLDLTEFLPSRVHPEKKINTGTQPCRFGSDEFPFQWGDFLGSSLQPLIFRVYLHIHRPFRFSLAVLAEAQPLAFWQGTITHPTWREKCVKITSQISIGFFWGFFFQSRNDLFISTCMYMYIYIYTYTYIRFCKLSTIFTWLSIWRCFCFFVLNVSLKGLEKSLQNFRNPYNSLT